ncbi:MAG: hypothetical protein GY906_00620 [bacterium]|nr:hypothetical protein [bacterium]
MKRFLTMAVVAGLALGGSSMAFAAFCTTDHVPAATVLFPFVVFDYNNEVDGENTFFTVTNVSSDPQIVHFTLWSDYSLHVLDWNVVLSGYDVQATSIRDILISGILPSTGTDGFDIADAPNPEGPAIPDGTLPVPLDRDDAGHFMTWRCPTSGLYYPVYGALHPALVARVKSYLRASQEADTGIQDCGTGDVSDDFTGFWFLDRDLTYPTWMYITADVVWTCNGMFPDSSANYWNVPNYNPAGPGDVDPNGAQGVYENVLFGDLMYLNRSANFSEAIPAPGLEAELPVSQGFRPILNPITDEPNYFYTQYVAALGSYTSTYGDFREPLPTAWGFRWLYNSVMGSKVRVFKRASANNATAEQSVGAVADLYIDIADLGAATDPPTKLYAMDCRPYTYYSWDEDENATSAVGGSTGPSCPPNTPECQTFRINLLPLETQQVDISQFSLPEPEEVGVPATSGWMMLVFPYSNVGSGDDLYQTYVSVRYDAHGVFSAAMPAAQLAHYACDPSQYLPWIGVGRYNFVQFAE